MKKYIVKNSRSKQIYGEQVIEARTFFDRLIGLMFIEKMDNYDGLIICACNSIHTFFMRFNIDVIFLDSNNNVVKYFIGIKPWRITPLYFKARKVIELNGGKLDPLNIKIGDKIEVICSN